MEDAGIIVIKAEADTDVLMKTAAGRSGVIVGKDTDLLVLLIALAERTSDVRMLISERKVAHKMY